MSIILASTSPRRSELLALLGIAFEVVPPTAEEIPSPDLSPREQAKQFALDKALSVARRHPDDLVLGGDTVIEIDGTLVGKPQDLDDADTMLRQLRGRSHHVHTGIALIHQAAHVTLVQVETAHVRMTPFTAHERGSPCHAAQHVMTSVNPLHFSNQIKSQARRGLPLCAGGSFDEEATDSTTRTILPWSTPFGISARGVLLGQHIAD